MEILIMTKILFEFQKHHSIFGVNRRSLNSVQVGTQGQAMRIGRSNATQSAREPHPSGTCFMEHGESL
jgi:hypothetical protein